MAEGEHLGEQTRNLFLKKATPLPGTAKHPQGRLFGPTGAYTGDPFKLSPENWLKHSATPAHGDPIAWHSSDSSQLPRFDDPYGRQVDQYEHEGADWDNEEIDPDTGEANEDYVDWSVDKKGRPMADYGSAVGMHFGDIKAATDRGKTAGFREHIHPVRIPGETIAAPPKSNFMTPRPGGGIAAGAMRSNVRVLNSETKQMVEDTRWSDPAANFATKATDLVEGGKTLAYRNDMEAQGSTSYRTLPETTRTWAEDVRGSRDPRTGMPPVNEGGGGWANPDLAHGFRNVPHPALVHLAEREFNPVVTMSDKPTGTFAEQPVQLRLPRMESWMDAEAGHNTLMRDVEAAEMAKTREQHFNAGRTAHLRKPKDDDAW